MSVRAHRVVLVAGLAVLAVALGPLDAAAHRGLGAHMVQHLLIAAAAPALVALGAPVRLALRALPPAGRRALGRALHAAPVRALAQPGVAVGLASAVLLACHLTPLLEAALAHPWLHALEHAALFWSALAAWMAILGVDPLPARPGAIGALAALGAWMLPMAAIGVAWTTAPDSAGRHAGGLVMWFGGLAVMAPAALALFARALWAEEARQRRRERLGAAP